MEYIPYELALDCDVSLEKKTKKSYMISTLFHDHVSPAAEKHITDIDAKGHAYLKFKDVNVETDFLRFQVFKRGKWFDDKQVGNNIYVRVSDLMSSSTTSNRQNQVGLEVYEFAKPKSKKYKGGLNLWYKLSKTQEKKAEVESKHVAAAIGNNMVPSLYTPLLSSNWQS